MTVALLPGARLSPLLSYLKALGTFRIVAEQHDASARLSWRRGYAVIEADTATEDSLREFLVERYEPTPILSPWNSRGGFRRDRTQRSETLLSELESSTNPRLARFRSAIAVGREIREEAGRLGFLVNEEVAAKQKGTFLELCRARFPDDALLWLDAVAVLTDAGPVYPVLLGGTGGNLGSGDLSSNYVEQVLIVTGARTGSSGLPDGARADLLAAALFRTGSPELGEGLVGQFDPGGAGGVNMPGRQSILNPWDLVLGLEGALLFAAGTSRRLSGTAGSEASVPFTVRPSVGTLPSHAEGENARAELWLPEWERPMRLRQLEQLLAEGRAQWGRAQARSGVDFVRAVATLGVDRAVTAFNRYLVAERLGQANLAVPSGRVVVPKARVQAVDLLHEVDGWLEQVDRVLSGPQVPQAVSTARNRASAAIFRVARQVDPHALQDVLAELGALEHAMSRARRVRERVRPVPAFDGARWLDHLNDGTPEFELALGLASQRDPLPKGELDLASRRMSRFSLMVRPVELDRQTRWLRWADQTVASGLGYLPLADVLARMLDRRSLTGERTDDGDVDVVQMRGVDVAFRRSLAASAATVRLLTEGDVDLPRVGRLAAGLSLLDWARAPRLERPSPPAGAYDPAWALLSPFFHARPLRVGTDDADVPERFVRFSPPATLVSAVVRRSLPPACQLAARRLTQYGVAVSVRPDLVARGSDPEAVLLALSVPLTTASVGRLLQQIDRRNRVRHQADSTNEET